MAEQSFDVSLAERTCIAPVPSCVADEITASIVSEVLGEALSEGISLSK